MTTSDDYPVKVDCRHQERYSRLLPLVKWLLVLPNVFVLGVVFIGTLLALIAGFFAVLVTGRYPRGIFDFVTGTIRWYWNVMAYTYFLTDSYPPFALAARPDHPATFEVAYPEAGIARWRPLVQWLLVFPYGIVAYLFFIAAAVLQLVAFFVILVTGKLPRGLFDFMLGALSWGLRASAYALWLTDRYPPFGEGPGGQGSSGGDFDALDSSLSSGPDFP